MTNLEAKKELARKLDIDYDNIAYNGLFTAADLQSYIQIATLKAWDYKPWDFTEGSKTGTTDSGMLTDGYIDYPEDIQSGSAYLLRVNGKEYKKLLFQDYLKFQEDYPDSTERVWSEQKRFIFINSNAYAESRTFDIFGKLKPPNLRADGDLLPFSPDLDDTEHSGNDAIVLLAYSEALASRKLNDPQGAEIERGKAYQLLDLLWKPFAEARSLLQSKNRPFFDVPDFFGNSASISLGNFNNLD